MEEIKKHPAGSSFWQILFPILLGGVLTVLVGIWFVIRGDSVSLSRFAEISTVLLVIPVFIVALIFVLILVGLIMLITRVMAWIPDAAHWILNIFKKIEQFVSQAARYGTRLVIEPAAFLAGIRREKRGQEQEISLND